MRVLIITSEWPTKTHPEYVPFLVTEINQLRKSGIDVEVHSFSGRNNPLNYLNAWIDLRKKYNLRNFDIIHAEWGQSGLLALPKKRPFVVTFRGGDLEGVVNARGKQTLSGRILRIVSRFVARKADRVVLVSDSLAKYIPNVSYSIVPVCLDTNLFKPMDKNLAREKLGLSQSKKLVLFPSNPARPEKRFHLAEAAVKLLGGEVGLVVTKNVPHEEMSHYFNACDVMVITSSSEGSPTVMYEALACNLPIVSVDVGDVRKRIEKFEGCMVCDNETPEGIAACIKKVLSQSSRLNSRNAMIEFNSEKFIEKMHQIYLSCLGLL